MKARLSALILLIFISGCISSSKLTGFVTPKLGPAPKSQPTENITFDYSRLESTGKAFNARALKKQFIPALFYWQWNTTIRGEIDPRGNAQYFEPSFLHAADSLRLSDKIRGSKLEVQVTEIPGAFMYIHKGNLVFYIFGYLMRDLEGLFPEEQNLVVNYTLSKDGQTTKQGVITAVNNMKPMNNVWKSTKKFTWLFLDQLMENNKKLTGEVVGRLIGEL